MLAFGFESSEQGFQPIWDTDSGSHERNDYFAFFAQGITRLENKCNCDKILTNTGRTYGSSSLGKNHKC